MTQPTTYESELASTKEELAKARKDLAAAKREFDGIDRLIKRYAPDPVYTSPLPGFTIQGTSIPINQHLHRGGDLIKLINFSDPHYQLEGMIEKAHAAKDTVKAERLEKNRYRFGGVVLDVEGHDRKDSIPASLISMAYSMGIIHELDSNGKITGRLEDRVNDMCYVPNARVKAATALRFSINKDGKGMFVSEGNHLPYIFRKSERKFDSEARKQWGTGMPFGLYPSKAYRQSEKSDATYREASPVNNTFLHRGDIMLVFTDGLVDVKMNSGKSWLLQKGEKVIESVHKEPADEIALALAAELAPHIRNATDDITYCVIKRE